MAASTNINGWNIGGNNNSFDQRGHFYRAFLDGNVSGMLVKQNSTPNMTVLVEHGSALLNKNTTSASVAEIKSDTSVVIDTANTSNPRIDTVVIYEDTSVAIPTAEASYWQDGAGGRFKIVSLPGTAAASPVALSDANIQTAIGAGKPWTRLANVTVPANSSTIVNSNINNGARNKLGVPLTNMNGGTTAGVLITDATGNVAAISPVIGYAEASNPIGNIFSTGYEILSTGTVTIPAGVTKVIVEADLAMSKNAAGSLHLQIKDNGTTVAERALSASAGIQYPLSVRRRINVVPGSSHTFATVVYPNADTGTVAGEIRTLVVRIA